jgi:hypothetical protein
MASPYQTSGIVAEDLFTVLMGKELAERTRGAIQYERATDDEDRYLGIDGWLWLAQLGKWIPLQLSLRSDEAKREQAKRDRVFFVNLSFSELLSMEEHNWDLNLVKPFNKKVSAQIMSQMPFLAERFITREEAPKILKTVYNH